MDTEQLDYPDQPILRQWRNEVLNQSPALPQHIRTKQLEFARVAENSLCRALVTDPSFGNEIRSTFADTESICESMNVSICSSVKRFIEGMANGDQFYILMMVLFCRIYMDEHGATNDRGVDIDTFFNSVVNGKLVRDIISDDGKYLDYGLYKFEIPSLFSKMEKSDGASAEPETEEGESDEKRILYHQFLPPQ